MTRGQVISEVLRLIDARITVVKGMQRQLRAEGGYRKSALPRQAMKLRGLHSERYAYERMRSDISFLRYGPKSPIGSLANLISSQPVKQKFTSSVREVLVLCGRLSEWESWTKEFMLAHPDTRVNRSTRRIEAGSVRYIAASSFQGTEGHCCSEVLKIGSYSRVFQPEEIRMIEFCASVAASRK